MLRINKLNIEAITINGKFGRKFDFSQKVNVIRGDNSSGKSSCIEALMYCLGIEEIIGGRREKVLKPVLRDEVEYNGKKYKIIESYILLEMTNENEKTITLMRSVTSEAKDSRLIRVFMGNMENINSVKFQDMFLHDPGAATHGLGFHKFLEEFIGWSLPNVPSFKEKEIKLYLQTIFPAFFIEQKKGWSDFLATIPTYYGIKNISNRVIEFILKLDVLDNKRKKEFIDDTKKEIKEKWNNVIDTIKEEEKKIKARVYGISEKPIIINENTINLRIVIKNENEFVDINIRKNEMMKEIYESNDYKTKLTGEVIEKINAKLIRETEELKTLEYNYKICFNNLKLDEKNYTDLTELLKIIEEDLERNKDVKKLMKLGSDFNLNIEQEICPACTQKINNTLLPQELNIETMNVKSTIDFLESQKKMIDISMKINEKEIKNKREMVDILRIEMQQKQQEIRELNKELVADERLPSEMQIRRKIELKNLIMEYELFENEIEKNVNKLKGLSEKLKEILTQENEMPDDYFSELDRKKLSYLKTKFVNYVKIFGYKSKPTDEIEISEDKYFPTINGFDMKFDASASDNIRGIWAYTCALMETSSFYNGNHINLLIFDEPGQHQIRESNLIAFFNECTKLNKSAEIIVATSIKNEDFIRGVNNNGEVNHIEIEDRTLMPIN